MKRRAVLWACVVLAGCAGEPPPREFPKVLTLDEAVAAMAWPADVRAQDGPRPGRPAIGMAPLPRPADFPLLRAWVDGREVARAPTYTPDASARELELLGELVFRTYCASCHGLQGRGDGPRAPMLDPRPRDFGASSIRFRSTATGSAPAEEDLFRTISGGLHGTGMMAFADLPEEQRWGVVRYLRSLAPRLAEEPEPIEVPPVPANLDDPERARRGQGVYARLKCFDCHGAGGKGDGPAAPTLRNDRGQTVAPRDLTTGVYKRGPDPAGMYLTLVSGLDGSPMASFAGSATPAELWELVAYVRSLASAR